MSYLAARRPGAASMQQVVDAGPAGDWEPAHRTAQAELATAAVLAELGPDWRVVHSLPVGPGPATLHHLVVGPTGIYAIGSLPPRATVVEVVDGQPTVSLQGSEDALAEVRQLAQRVLAGLRHRLGGAVDIPAVHPMLCVADSSAPPVRPTGSYAEVVGRGRLVAQLEARPRRLTSTWVQRLAAVALEPRTWDAPGAEWIVPDVQARYEAVTRSTRRAREADPDDRVVIGQVTVSSPPQLAAQTPGLRTASVLLVLFGMASMGTGGVLSPPTLAFGGWTIRHYGGWRWLNDRDASLFMVGMVMAALPLPFLVLMMSAWAASRA